MPRFSPTPRGLSIVDKLLTEIELDNGCNVRPHSCDVMLLKIAVWLMRIDGCKFTDDQIELIAAGEQTEALDTFKNYLGYQLLSDTLNYIFDNCTV